MRNLQNLIKTVREHTVKTLRFYTVYWANVDAINVAAPRPLTVTRMWQGNPISLNCYVTKRIVELYQAGQLAEGDGVLVAFIDGDQTKPIALEKIHV